VHSAEISMEGIDLGGIRLAQEVDDILQKLAAVGSLVFGMNGLMWYEYEY
jgi:hypothetical protein